MQRYEARPGEHISDAIHCAIAQAKLTGEAVKLVFNDTEILVSEKSDAVELVELYHVLREIR